MWFFRPTASRLLVFTIHEATVKPATLIRKLETIQSAFGRVPLGFGTEGVAVQRVSDWYVIGVKRYPWREER